MSKQADRILKADKPQFECPNCRGVMIEDGRGWITCLHCGRCLPVEAEPVPYEENKSE